VAAVAVAVAAVAVAAGAVAAGAVEAGAVAAGAVAVAMAAGEITPLKSINVSVTDIVTGVIGPVPLFFVVERLAVLALNMFSYIIKVPGV
jgi:hypothetical protein